MTAAEALARLAAATAVTVEVWAGAGWAGRGEGAVSAVRDGAGWRIEEAGTWALEGSRPMRWTARSRWWAEGAALAVEHDRPGVPASAVLDWAGGGWQARAPHLCPPDAYGLAVWPEADALAVVWTVTGPHKADRIVTRYR